MEKVIDKSTRVISERDTNTAKEIQKYLSEFKNLTWFDYARKFAQMNNLGEIGTTRAEIGRVLDFICAEYSRQVSET